LLFDKEKILAVETGFEKVAVECRIEFIGRWPLQGGGADPSPRAVSLETKLRMVRSAQDGASWSERFKYLH